MPYRRWIPPKAVIEAFESEGFIWGGKWTLWDNMHFEYRPELLYIRNFVLKAEFNEFIAQDTQGLYQTPQIEPEKQISQRLADIFKMAELIKFTSSFSHNILSFTVSVVQRRRITLKRRKYRRAAGTQIFGGND